MLLNNDEIDHALSVLKRAAPEIAPYAQYLSDYRDEVNANSDGWAYWRAGTRAADKLSNLISAAVGAARGHGEMPDELALKKSLTPIRSACTRFKLKAPELKLDNVAPKP